MTLHGKVHFSRYILLPKTPADRAALLAENKRMVVPLDEALGISGLPFKMTVNLMLEIAYWAQSQCSYESAEQAIYRALGLRVNDDTVRKVCNTIGKLVYDMDCAQAQQAAVLLETGKLQFPLRKKRGVLYIQADGAALNTRQKDAQGSTWRESKLGVVFSSDDLYRWIDNRGQPRHKINAREYVGYIGSVQEFQKHLFAAALRHGYGIYEKTVVIGDGAAWIRNMTEQLFPDAQQILDYYHLCENVNNCAKLHFNNDEQAFRPWAEQMCKLLKEGHWRQVLAALEGMNSPHADRLHGYISNNKKHIDYPKYLQESGFIGSGAIESGNKIVLQKRLKQAGMRWNPVCAQYLLSLRAKHESNLWNSTVVLPALRHFQLPLLTCDF